MTQVSSNSTLIIISKAVLFCIINTALLKFSLFITSSIPDLSKNFLSSAIGPMLALLITYLFLKLDKQSFSSIGLEFQSSTLRKFCVGFLIGAGIMGLFVLSIVYSSGFKIQLSGNANLLFLLFIALPTIILLAFMEETIFRGYPLVILKNKAGALTALIITSILFGLYHVVFGRGITGFFSTSIWGLAFGLLAIYSNGIAMPTGFHSAGNLMQSALGMTGSSYCIWSVVSINGQQVEYFPNGRATIIAQLIVLVLIILSARFVLRNKNFRKHVHS